MTEWERTNMNNTHPRWVCAQNLGGLQPVAQLAGIVVAADNCEGILIVTTNSAAQNTDMVFDGTDVAYRLHDGDRVFGGPIIDGQFTEYESMRDVVPFTLPTTETCIKFREPVTAALCWIVHRSITAHPHMLREFSPRRWVEAGDVMLHS